MIGWIVAQWPQVYPNLIASGISGVLAWLWARAKFARHEAAHERRHREQMAAHARVAAHLRIDNGEGGGGST